MKANVFRGKNNIRVEEVEKPRAGVGEGGGSVWPCRLTPLLTHTFPLDRIGEAYDLFGERLDGVMKVAIKP